MFKKIILLALSLSLVFFSSCKGEIQLEAQTQIALGTVCSIKLPKGTKNSVYEECFKILSNVEQEISRTREDSYISVLNRDKKVQTNTEVFQLFEYAIDLAKESEGKFNIAMGKVVSLWDIGGSNQRIPSSLELNEAKIDYNEIILDKANLSISIPSNMEIDFGALGKGYAGDKLRDYLKSVELDKAIVNLGGNVLVIGNKSENQPWTIGLQDPNDIEKIFVALKVEDLSIVTSGTYERFFYQEGIKYHHILDPNTLYPSESDILSSTIIGKDSLICDSLSTTCFLLGREKALEFMKNYEDYSAFFLLSDNSIVTSDNFNYEYRVFEN
jgi:thiamine biosynthesis lipoprotein